MEGLAGYGGSSSEEEEGAIQQWGGPRPAVNLAPQVDVTAETEFRAYVDPSAKTVATNPTFEALSQPVQGPKHPFNRSGSLSKAQMNLANGNLEVAGISAYSFDEQLHTFGEPPAHTAARAALVGPPPLSARTLGGRRLLRLRLQPERAGGRVHQDGGRSVRGGEQEWVHGVGREGQEQGREEAEGGRRGLARPEQVSDGGADRGAEGLGGGAGGQARGGEGGGGEEEGRGGAGAPDQDHLPRDGALRLPGPELCGRAERALDGAAGQELPAQEVRAHVERPHEGRDSDPVLPEDGAPAAVGLAGQQGQDLERERRPQVHAHLHRPHEGRARHLLHQRRPPLRLCGLRCARTKPRYVFATQTT